MSQTAQELGERLNFALRLAAVATAEITPRFRACVARRKADGTDVTDADLAAEEAMRTLLARECPNEPVLGEEFGGDVPRDAERAWILDPIDGTQAFALGVPTFGALIGYAERGAPVLGVMAFPALDQMVFAAKGLGCKRRTGADDAVTLRAAKTTVLRDAYASATSLLASSTLSADGLALDAVVKRANRFRFVGDCLQHALVCEGRLDVAIDLIVAPWDVAAVIPCLEEAGAVAAAANGSRENLLYAGSLIGAATPELMRDVAGALAR